MKCVFCQGPIYILREGTLEGPKREVPLVLVQCKDKDCQGYQAYWEVLKETW